MFSGKGKYVDLAGGYGLLTRLMRDMGFDYYWTDRYAQNVLARGFEGTVGGSERYQAATAFEVLEHLEDPVEFIRQAFSSTQCSAFFFSTVLYAGAEPPQSWWYYTQGTGQHISFFHRRTLEYISNKLGLRLYSRGSFHLLSQVPVSKPAYSLLTSNVNVMIFPILAEKLLKSKIEEDHTRMLDTGQAGVGEGSGAS
jgi:Methyltransferase domain